MTDRENIMVRIARELINSIEQAEDPKDMMDIAINGLWEIINTKPSEEDIRINQVGLSRVCNMQSKG